MERSGRPRTGTRAHQHAAHRGRNAADGGAAAVLFPSGRDTRMGHSLLGVLAAVFAVHWCGTAVGGTAQASRAAISIRTSTRARRSDSA